MDCDEPIASLRLLSPNTAVELVVRSGQQLVPRLYSVSREALPTLDVLHFASGGVYTVTGGTGALGHYLAEWMQCGAGGQTVLLSRSGVAQGSSWCLDRQPSVAICDVSQRMCMAFLVSRLGALRGIVHAAGLDLYAPVAAVKSHQVQAVLAPKVDGTRNLADESASRQLDAFLVFSSTSAVFGLKGYP